MIGFVQTVHVDFVGAFMVAPVMMMVLPLYSLVVNVKENVRAAPFSMLF